MKWLIPAKTFLLGEYAAISGDSAIVLTTSPCFELTLSDQADSQGIHPDSPAGLWWKEQNIKSHSLIWHDPYLGCGGLGASSAQFLGSYLASCFLKNQTPDMSSMLNAYYQVSWSGKGLKPSGYDVIAQSHQGCVYINKNRGHILPYTWPFAELSFLLLHTGIKLATHHHLQNAILPKQIDKLSNTVDEAKSAFENRNGEQLVHSINTYHLLLTELHLVAPHSRELINHLTTTYPEILAIKGCGALGSDVLLIITSQNNMPPLKKKLLLRNWSLLASEKQLATEQKSLQMVQSAYFNKIAAKKT